VDARAAWTREDILQESEGWVHLPSDGVVFRDERRLLVHLPERWATSRVWRSWPADEEQAVDLIEETIRDARAAGSKKLVWHTGDRVSPPFMDRCLASCGFEVTEDLAVLAFELCDGQEPTLPRLGVPVGVRAELVRDPEGLRQALLVDSAIFSSPPPSGEEFAEYAGQLRGLRHREGWGAPGGRASVSLRFVAFVAPASEDRGNYARRAVAAAGAEVVGETVRLWGASTLENYRGRGAYRALVVERCRIARSLGATLALTRANAATSAPILERAGFRSVAEERRRTLRIC
jgi:hypothetical protein